MYRTVFAFLAATLLWAQPCFAQCLGTYGQWMYVNGQLVYANGQQGYGYTSYYGGPNRGAEIISSQPAIQAGGTQAGGTQAGGTQAGAQAGFQGGITQAPWFANPTIRQQLNLNNQQYTQLNNAYSQAWNKYNTSVGQLGANLPTDQRQQQLNNLGTNFYKNFSTATNNAITDPQQRQRFNQLYWQYRGYGAFTDPAVQQKLNLTNQQQQKLNQYATDWNNQMNTLGQTYRTDRQGATKNYQQMQSKMNQNINSVLTPEQQRTWREMTGEPYQFQPDVYFQTGTSSTNNGTQQQQQQ